MSAYEYLHMTRLKSLKRMLVTLHIVIHFNIRRSYHLHIIVQFKQWQLNSTCKSLKEKYYHTHFIHICILICRSSLAYPYRAQILIAKQCPHRGARRAESMPRRYMCLIMPIQLIVAITPTLLHCIMPIMHTQPITLPINMHAMPMMPTIMPLMLFILCKIRPITLPMMMPTMRILIMSMRRMHITIMMHFARLIQPFVHTMPMLMLLITFY